MYVWLQKSSDASTVVKSALLENHNYRRFVLRIRGESENEKKFSILNVIKLSRMITPMSSSPSQKVSG